MSTNCNNFSETVVTTETVPTDPRAICVFCGSSPGHREEYRKAAASLGKALASTKRTLVYGGGDRGLMGIVSDSIIANGGSVVGIVPQAMVLSGGEGEGPVQNPHKVALPADNRQSRTIVVSSMHERKTLMAKIAGGGFVALPGGFGTFEEVLEAITWSQIGIHKKPVVLVNTNHFWNPLRDLIDSAIREGFIKESSRDLAVFLDPPTSGAEDFDWGKATVDSLDGWKSPVDSGLFIWKAT